MRTLVFAISAFAVACVPPSPQSTPAAAPLVLSFRPDTQRSERIADGITRHFIYSGSGPWAINVLQVDRYACYSAVAVKGYPNSIGRKKTSQLLTELDSSGTVVGGVNADFFAPNGRPTNLHISSSDVFSGPSRQPVLAFDSTGAPHLTTFQSAQTNFVQPLPAGWNRPRADHLAFFDTRWGATTDSAAQAIEVTLTGPPDSMRVVGIDTMPAGVPIPPHGRVMVLHGASHARAHQSWGDPAMRVPVQLRLTPFHPREAIGGRPILIKDSAVVPAVDTEGAAGFATSRHPRTAVGIASNGQRLLLVTVDGRQKPYSDGMTLRELANLMLALGARDAINLDGGGSTTLVYKDPASKRLTIANRPSDPTGERAVGNALAIVKGCARR